MPKVQVKMGIFLAARQQTGAVFHVAGTTEMHRIIKIITPITVRQQDQFLDLTKAHNKLLEVHHNRIAVRRVTRELTLL